MSHDPMTMMKTPDHGDRRRGSRVSVHGTVTDLTAGLVPGTNRRKGQEQTE